MICPKCNGRAMCKDSRYVQGTRRRRYVCKCSARFTTSEFVTHFAKNAGRKSYPRQMTTAQIFLQKQGLAALKDALGTLLNPGEKP